MTRREGLLITMAVVLVGAMAWQYLPQTSVPGPAGPKPAVVAPASGLNPLAGRPVTALAALAAHPLFAPDRTPPAAAVVAPAETLAPPPLEVVPPAAAPDPASVAPVLQGVVASPFPGGAYLSDGQGGESIFLRPGQAALGLTLEEVFPDHATFMGPDGEVTLTLAPPPAAQPPDTPPPDAPPPADPANP
jgi:hypothetical protein